MIARVLAIGAGFLLTLAFGLACLAAQGALKPFLEIQWTFNRLVHGGYTHPFLTHMNALKNARTTHASRAPRADRQP